MSICFRRKTKEQALYDIFEKLDIDIQQKIVLQDRYLRVLENFHLRSKKLSVAYYTARIIVTVGSILVPAFLSIQDSCNDRTIHWITWVLSLGVTISNGFMTLFKLDKKYYFINTTLEMLHSEGWQYIGLTGRYSAKDSDIEATHENQFKIFFRMAEKIKMRQVEEEFWKFTDTSGVGNATNHNGILPSSTPAVKQSTLESLQDDKKAMFSGWLDDMKKSQPSGLKPRAETTFIESDRIINSPIIDEGENSPRVPESSKETSLPVRSPLSETTFTKTPELLLSPGAIQIPKDTLVEIVPDESSDRERT